MSINYSTVTRQQLLTLLGTGKISLDTFRKLEKRYNLLASNNNN